MRLAFPSLALAVALAGLSTASRASAAQFVVSPPASIQDAVNFALAGSDVFDVIFVNPGTYDEAVTIDFTGTTQIGLIIARNTSVQPKVSGGITVQDARLVSLLGLKVDSSHGDSNAAITLRRVTGVAIADCRGFAGDAGGVDADDCYEVIVDGCEFSGMTNYGVRITGRCGHEVKKSTTNDNDNIGIWIEADRTVVKSCSAEGNGVGAIQVIGVANSVLSCDASKNDGYGVGVIGTATIKGNDIIGNSGTGVRLGDDLPDLAFGGAIKKNTINGNGFGIVIKEDHDGCDISGNKLSGNKGAGIRVSGDRQTIAKNSVKNTSTGSAGGHGVLITGSSSGNCVEDNTFSGNDGDGVMVEGNDNYLVENNAKGNDGFIDGVGTTGNDGRLNQTVNGSNDFP